MAYRPCLIYTPEGDFLGYVIRKDNAIKLQSTNIWSDLESSELQEQLDRLNDSVAIHSAWPDANDPEVLAILADPEFMPVEEAPVEAVDEENSHLVYIEEIDGGDGELDKESSVIKYKTIMAPVRPSDVVERVKAACEAVAKKRSSANITPV